ncbi:MAG: metallopeptidase [bacterium]|nr:metallopeptidase [bacterium]
MTTRFFFPSIILFLPLAIFAQGGGESEHLQRAIRGWTLFVERALVEREPALSGRALELLDAKLLDIERALPDGPLARLKEVPIWIDLNHEPFPGAVYHPSADWLREHGHDPRMAGAVHIANATNFIEWSKHQYAMVLHEMAHAYHHQVLGYDHEGIKQAFEHARREHLYESVLLYNGEHKRAYALENEQEYFAECTEAFYGVNDFYPFVRAELQEYDPVMFETLQSVWEP